jgi:hypothetical protein
LTDESSDGRSQECSCTGNRRRCAGTGVQCVTRQLQISAVVPNARAAAAYRRRMTVESSVFLYGSGRNQRISAAALAWRRRLRQSQGTAAAPADARQGGGQSPGHTRTAIVNGAARLYAHRAMRVVSVLRSDRSQHRCHAHMCERDTSLWATSRAPGI